MKVCVTLNSPSTQSGARRCYILAHLDSDQVAPLQARHLFLEVGVMYLPVPAYSSRVSDC